MYITAHYKLYQVFPALETNAGVRGRVRGWMDGPLELGSLIACWCIFSPDNNACFSLFPGDGCS